MEMLSVLQALDVMQKEYAAVMTKGSLVAWIRCGKCPFGAYIKKEGKTKGSYVVFRRRMEEYFNPKYGVHNPLIIAQEKKIYFS